MKKKFVKTERRLSFISSQNETLHSPRITMYGSDNRINSYMDSQTEREKMIQKSTQILFAEGLHQTPRNPVTPKNAIFFLIFAFPKSRAVFSNNCENVFP